MGKRSCPNTISHDRMMKFRQIPHPKTGHLSDQIAFTTVHRVFGFSEGITDETSKKLVRKVKNRYGVEAFPWERESIR
jgi:hypothetical protein